MKTKYKCLIRDTHGYSGDKNMLLSTKTSRPNFKLSENVHNYCGLRGIEVNMSLLRSYLNKYTNMAETLREQCIDETFGLIDNPNSSKQVQNYFYGNFDEVLLKKFFWKYDIKQKANKFTFGANELTEYYKSTQDKTAKLIIEFRTYSGAVSDLTKLSEKVARDGCVHPTFSARDVSTNRVYVKDPNIQALTSKLFEDIFVPDEYIIIDTDYKQQEPKLNALDRNAKKLIEVTDGKPDFYFAAILPYLGLTPDQTTEEQRDQIKQAWNAMNYGAKFQKIRSICTQVDFKQVITAHHELNLDSDPVDYTQMRTMFDTQMFVKHTNERALIAARYQGTGADILCFAIEAFLKQAQKLGFNGYKSFIEGNYDDIDDMYSIYYTMHDGLRILAHNRIAEEFGKDNLKNLLKDVLTVRIDDKITIGVKVTG